MTEHPQTLLEEHHLVQEQQGQQAMCHHEAKQRAGF
jgi:hypothetical protein